MRFIRSEDGIQSYLSELRRYRKLSHREEREVLERMRAGDKQAFRTLIESNLRFVVAVCRRYEHQGLSLTDLVGEGNLGLIHAAMHFDVTRSCRFITYAVWWIRQRILLSLSGQARCLSVPPGRTAALQKVLRAQKALEQALGRAPSAGEVADHLSMKEAEVGNIQVLRQPSISLDAPVSADEGLSYGDFLEDERAESPDGIYMEDRRRKQVGTALDALHPREGDILRLYFGIGEGCRLSLDEIGERVGLTRERVRQLKDMALKRLRHPSRRALLAGLI